VCAAVVVLRRFGLRHPAVYLVPGIALWICVHESGVHATIAGVILALLIPTSASHDDPVERIERRFHPWTGFVVVPLFALANTGVAIDADSVERAVESPVTLGILTGLVIGKMLGIAVFSWAALRLRVARLPSGLDGLQIGAVAIVAGIGFTVSLFVAELAFSGAVLADAKIGILAASIVAGSCGLGAVALASRRGREQR
jgi:NhaA family Na+:H+ antiporter